MRAAGVAGAVALALSAGGCASIVSGQTDHVRVTSEPQGRACTLYQGADTVARVVTPQTVAVERTGEGLLAVCGEDREREASGLNPWTLVNILFIPPGILGLAVDWATGASQGYDDIQVKGSAS